MNYETIIGLEIHCQLLTESKMFCGCSTKFGNKPNTNICPVCTGQPGSLPVVNKKAIELAIKTALALGGKINPRSVFARKNYFYPDLPKDYQISQFELPLAEGGFIEIDVEGKKKRIGITRVHLEEDAGKLVHQGAARIMGSAGSLADYNRTGTPLMEIVSEPDMRSPAEAKAFMEALQHLLKFICVSDAKMEEGSLRCDANISIRPMGADKFGVKSEVKNMNSFKAVFKALTAEEKRHNQMVDDGTELVQETRYYDENTDTTTGMRTKESSHDYRYFPEPDLVPVEPAKEWVEAIGKTLGEMPEQKKDRYEKDYGISSETAEILISSPALMAYFEDTARIYDKPAEAAKWIVGDLAAYLKENNLTIEKCPASSAQLVDMLKLLDNGTISGKIAKTVLVDMLKTGKNVNDIVKESGMTQISDEGELVKIVQEVIKNNPAQVEQFKSGKETVIMYLVGQVMKASKGRAKPDLVQKLLRENLL